MALVDPYDAEMTERAGRTPFDEPEMVIRNRDGVPAESAELYAAVEWLKAEGYRIVKLEKKVDMYHYRVGEYDVVEEL